LKCQNLTQILKLNPEVDQLIEEITLRHQHLFNIKPEYKLGLIFLITAKNLDDSQSNSNVINNYLKTETKKELNEKYKDFF